MADTKSEASLFLMEATLGANRPLVNRVAQQGIKPWLQTQLNADYDPNKGYKKATHDIWQSFRARLKTAYGENAINGEGNNPALPYNYYFRMAWWHKTLTEPYDSHQLLRQRIALALSEIIVISDNSQLELDSVAMASFYDILYRNALGKYSDILYETAMHPCLGVYLSHLNNFKADPVKNIHPDENFAREIMQLFSIGLFMLNPDGSRQKDANGHDIPTYRNTDIRQMARVFTGLKAKQYQYEWNIPSFPYNGDTIHFADGVSKVYKTVPYVDMIQPMIVDPTQHDTDPKDLLNGHIRVPGNQVGADEIRTVINRLVSHSSTAPFIAHKLIQQLTCSNPSRAYIQAAAESFGTDGDMKATLETILTHPEAKKPKKLKSPILRITQLLRAFNVKNASGKAWILGDDIKFYVRQHPLSSPTVFNFYRPDYSPHGAIQKAKKVAPEFELEDSSTTLAWYQMLYDWFYGDAFPLVSTTISTTRKYIAETDPEKMFSIYKNRLLPDFHSQMALAQGHKYEELISSLSLLLCGTPNCLAKQLILDTISNFQNHPKWVVQTTVFLIATSPQFAVLEATS